MFSTLKTLISGANARAEEAVKDRYAIELIDQKIREAQADLAAAKSTLASLIQRERQERRHCETIDAQLADLTARARQALACGREDLAGEAAGSIADMENERALRGQTLDRLGARIVQLRGSVEAANRRIIDLRQGATTARAIRREQDIQARMQRTVHGVSAADEADALIRRVSERDDPFEQSQILNEINASLSHDSAADKLADAGFGPATTSTRAAVLERLRADL